MANFGFDLDGVFINTPPFIPQSIINLLYKKGLFLKSSNSGKLSLEYEIPGKIEQKIRLFFHYPIFRPIIKEDYKALKRISKKPKVKTYLISSRYGFLRSRTGQLIDKYKFNKYFDGVYFNFDTEQPHLFKEKIIKKLKIDSYIEDDFELALYLATRIPSITIYWVAGIKHIPNDLPENIIPIKTLKDLERKLFP